MKGRVSVTDTNNANKRNKKLTFKNNAPFRSCISKINNTFVDNAVDLDIVMPMCNVLAYSGNYSITCGSLWNYYRYEVNDSVDENENNCAIDFRINNFKTTTSKYFEYKTKLIVSTPDNTSRLNAEVAVPFKYSNIFGDLYFWRSFD